MDGRVEVSVVADGSRELHDGITHGNERPLDTSLGLAISLVGSKQRGEHAAKFRPRSVPKRHEGVEDTRRTSTGDFLRQSAKQPLLYAGIQIQNPIADSYANAIAVVRTKNTVRKILNRETAVWIIR
jgi:hypothetical protein